MAAQERAGSLAFSSTSKEAGKNPGQSRQDSTMHVPKGLFHQQSLETAETKSAPTTVGASLGVRVIFV